ncbi:MBL fold metallo-hydrolase [Geomonas propionica]|uniref:MBL fold metallo-hydrolase n=1 Tax=Geomonas propionica TaxID=2798582 RepID=A0ABS0YTU6_9BACT|nr:MBL fold metallo-hydrolase [Geomonas propionica]MBJ6801293.1 MBL fold metallo-hydrolase [Geomonas propionica]
MICRIRVLCDNTAGAISGTLGEHGFAALVQAGDQPLLFDTGGGHTLLHNAQRMNVDLKSVDQVVLSHGHYDHAGGLWPLLQAAGPKRILAHPGVFTRRYVLREGSTRSVGIPYSEDFLTGLGASFSYSDAFREVMPGVFLTGEVPRATSYEEGDAGLFCDEAGCQRDQVTDDQSLVIVTEKGLLLLLGCCHAGVVNTLELARERTGVEQVYGVVGGCHLAFSSQPQIDATIKALKRYGLKKICPGHCTGFHAAARLATAFPGGFKPMQVGYVLEVD